VRVRSKAILSYGGIGDDEDESDDEAPLPAATRHSSGIPAATWRLLQGIHSSNQSVAKRAREIAVQEPLAFWQKVQVDVILQKEGAKDHWSSPKRAFRVLSITGGSCLVDVIKRRRSIAYEYCASRSARLCA
jgi:hypothetical protein